jgi:hypothetical protein
VQHAWKRRGIINVLVRKLEGRRLLGIPRRREEDNIRMDLKEFGWDGVSWIYLAKDKVQ